MYNTIIYIYINTKWLNQFCQIVRPKINPCSIPEMYTQLSILKTTNPMLRIVMAVGGWSAYSMPFLAICDTQATLNSFAINVISFLRQYGFDGFDLDWQYPSQAPRQGKEMFTQLVKVSVLFTYSQCVYSCV